MSNARRVPVTLCVALIGALAPAGARAATAAPAPAPTTTTTAPPVAPPPAFGLPADFGLQLVQAQAKAKRDLAAAQTSLAPANRQLAAARREDKAVRRRLAEMRRRVEATKRKLEETRRHLRLAAARAYIRAGSADLAIAFSSFTNANSAVDVASSLHMLSTYHDSEREALEEYLALKEKLERQVRAIAELSERTARALRAAEEFLWQVHVAINDAARRIAETVAGFEQFAQAATSASSPILGPSRLSANQMAAFVMLNGYRPRITVPIDELAQLYLDEGARTGVRGDVAFAQAILETAGFAHPGSRPTDNNFAGIGWCDSCRHGYNFPDARAGVRAQLQLLRIYADAAFPDETYTDPILLPGTLELGFRGKVLTWWDLWGTWATGALYGQRVYEIYERMVRFAARVPAEPPKELPLPIVPPDSSGVTRPPGTGPGSLTR